MRIEASLLLFGLSPLRMTSMLFFV